MEQQPNDKQSVGSEAIRVILSIGVGAGIGYALWLATGSNVLGIMMSIASAHLVNNFLRNIIK